MQSRNKGKDKKRSISLLTPFLLPRLMYVYDCMQISYLTKTSTSKKKLRPGAKFEMNINLLGIQKFYTARHFTSRFAYNLGNKQMAYRTYLLTYTTFKHAMQ